MTRAMRDDTGGGRAVATYTAPLSLSGVDTQAEVEILVTPVGDNYASAVPRSLTIRLVPSGIVTPPLPPVAFTLVGTPPFSVTPATPTELSPVVFHAGICSGSTASNCVSDPNGQVVSFLWDFGDGALGSGQTAGHTYAAAGSYLVILTVADQDDRSVSGSTSLTVNPIGVPTPLFDVSPSPTTVATVTIVDATASTASTGATIVSYTWNFGDSTDTTTCPGAAGCNGAVFSHTYSSAGSFTITLTVTDSVGRTGTLPRGILVTLVQVTAGFTFTNTSQIGDFIVNFDASSSTGSILTYVWDFGDGNLRTVAQTVPTVTHAFADGAVYNVTLFVTDSEGSTASLTLSVTPD